MKTVRFSNNDETKKLILQLFGKSVDGDGYIIETKTGVRVVTPGNEEIPLSKFAGIRPGSEIFVTNDLPALLEQSEYFDN